PQPSDGRRAGAHPTAAGLPAPPPGQRPAPARNGPVRGSRRPTLVGAATVVTLHHPPVFPDCSVFQVAAGGGGPDAGFQWPAFFSASATSFGIYVSSCLASTSEARNEPSACSVPSVTTP